jgi:hypothetical protein
MGVNAVVFKRSLHIFYGHPASIFSKPKYLMHLRSCIILPVILYGCECWSLKLMRIWTVYEKGAEEAIRTEKG